MLPLLYNWRGDELSWRLRGRVGKAVWGHGGQGVDGPRKGEGGAGSDSEGLCMDWEEG